ncbi:hypothetical protein EW146_g37 [Bondarzewia mesenterica]|uniref:V-type proton ATPase subunit C n=1 Tax=Bondarzewia mesenterica TaxID=1095465 RepID=A0A4V3XGI7_9AGAM|nr:hypothetical protein EW146_g37 [Bondarzewia mesenterica]
MPSDQSTWLIAAPQDGDSEGMLQELYSKLSQQSKTFSRNSIGQLYIPSFKVTDQLHNVLNTHLTVWPFHQTGTLDSLIALSEELPKQDAFFTATVAKIVETLRNLLNNDPAKLSQHILVNEHTVDNYLLKDWRWNDGRYGVQKGLRDMTEVLNKEMTSIDNMMKTKLNNYNLAKGSLTQLQRKKIGNLSVRSLADVVNQEDFIQDSEYLETLLVAVPRNLVKEWNAKYERLTSMVVPRSASAVASDDEYTLFSVVIFRKVHEDFVQKCRENKYIIRDFQYSENLLSKEREELLLADTTEKELWTELLRLSRTNFSEAFQLLVHLKVVRLFIESVLRYGLPANYIGVIIKPEPKSTKRTLTLLKNHFTYLSPRSRGAKPKSSSGGGTTDEFVGEYQTLLEQEYFDFVLPGEELEGNSLAPRFDLYLFRTNIGQTRGLEVVVDVVQHTVLFSSATSSSDMYASLVRRQLGGLVPPKIASPSILSAGQGADLAPLVNFYSKLPKGPAAAPAVRGIKARYFDGKNASAAPVVLTMVAIFGLGYTIDYQMHLKHHKNHAH